MGVSVNKDAVTRYKEDTRKNIQDNIDGSEKPSGVISVEVGEIGLEYGTSSKADPLADFYKTVGGRRNVLHDYNTYNYVISLVSLSNDQLKNPDLYKGLYTGFIDGGYEAKDFFIVARSSGFKRSNAPAIGVSVGGVDSPDKSAPFKNGRESQDFFIDNLVFDTLCGINPEGNSNLTKGSFEVMEPFGVGGFYEQLYNAARFAGHDSYIRAPFLLVIDFVGRKAELDSDPEHVENSKRYIPIMFAKSNMKVEESGARYNVEFLGFNSQTVSPIYGTLVSELEGASHLKTQTVETVLYDTFKKNNEAFEKYYQGLVEDSDSYEKKQEAVKRINSTEAVLKANGLPRKPFEPHKWCIWFPSDYARISKQGGGGGGGGEFPSNLKDLKYSDWEGRIDPFVQPDNNGVKGSPPYANDMSVAEFGEGQISFNGVALSPEVEKEKEEKKTAYDQAKEKLNTAKTALDSLKAIIESQRTAILTILKNYPPAEKTFKSTDTTLKIKNKPEDTVRQAEFINDLIIYEANVDGEKPVNPYNIPPADITTIVQATKKLRDATSKLNGALGDVKTAETAVETAEKGLRDSFRPRKPSNLQQPWKWRKGSNLLQLIEFTLINSNYTNIFKDKLGEIESSEYVPWWRVEVFADPVAFDTFTMDFVYHFHYIVQPYKVHYSQIPGVSVVFSTDKLKKDAIREYNYIFTGKNLDVLNFDIQYNNLFFMPMIINPPKLQSNQVSTGQDDTGTEKQAFNPKAVGDAKDLVYNKLGIPGFKPAHEINWYKHPTRELDNRNDVAKAFNEFLFRPMAEQALINIDLQIIGDPVYIIGSGITHRPKLTFDDIETGEGEMNTFSREVDFVLNFRYPEDYPTQQEVIGGQYNQKLKRGQYSGVYKLVRIENRFSEGSFTQTLKGLRRQNQQEDFDKESGE